ncbi:alpha/beta fold hydrolase [Streptomyces sp. NPDC058374]|uniref:alpha/beta fold hydrolase n=1 Tax=Streptomyces sp. NPDC058374 TaxID=3346466 RepID=UPI00364A5225
MPQLELSAGVVDYEDTGGDGPVVVLLHGVAMDASLWDEVVPGLREEYRCVRPVLPLGGHRRPMRAGADLSVAGVARLVAEVLEKLELREVTLVLNDWGGAQALFALGLGERVGRLVLTSCEAFDNYPPGLPGRNLVTAARIPGGLAAAFGLLRFRPARRLPMTWGWMSKRPVAARVMDRWVRPAQTDPEIRRDLRAYLLGVPPREELLRWAEALRGFQGPALVAWAAEDKVMPVAHGRRLAELLPRASYVEIPDSRTLLPQDQPAELTRCLRKFLADTAA